MGKTVDIKDYMDRKSGLKAHFDVRAAREKNVIGTKICSARKERGLSQQQLCDLLAEYGVSVKKAALSKWETGDSLPNSYQLLALCIALSIEDGIKYFIGDVKLKSIQKDSLSDGLNSEGKKLLSQYADYLKSKEKYQISSSAAPYIEYRDMPYYEIGASAGPGQMLDEDHADWTSFPVDSIPEDADYAVRVVGTSMEPVYHDGQYVWVHQTDQLENGEVGIFEWNGCSYIKVYREEMPDLHRECETDEDVRTYEEYLDQFIDSEGVVHPQILLISYNNTNGSNPPKVIRPDDSFHIFGRVLK